MNASLSTPPCRQGRGGTRLVPSVRDGCLLTCLLLAASSVGADWVLEGDLGLELESVRESFSVPDTVLIDVAGTPGTPVEDQFETIRFRDRDTLTDGLIRVRLANTGERWNVSMRGRLSTGSRTRQTLDLEASHRTEGGSRLRLYNYFYGQSGGSESRDGFQNKLSLMWEPAWLGDDWNLRWKGYWDLSQSARDSLSGVFNYNRVRTGLRVQRSWGWGRSLGIEGEWSGKWMDESGTGDYRSGEARVDLDWEFDRATTLYAAYGIERRDYSDSRTLSDSYWDNDVWLRATRRLSEAWSLEGTATFRATDYDTPGTIFFDNQTVVGQILTRRYLGANWSVKAGPGAGWLNASSEGAFGSYVSGHGQLEIAYEPLGDFWFHAMGRLGRRDYHRPGERQVISFEGYNLGLTTSDYTFTSVSVLGQADVPLGMSVELFLQHDFERHDVAEDDFSLTLLTLRVSRSL